MAKTPLYPHITRPRAALYPHTVFPLQPEVSSAQRLADEYTGIELMDRLLDLYEKIEETHGRDTAQKFLDQEVVATLWHGTRRKEPIEHLRQYGFCTYTDEQAVAWLAEAYRQLREKTRWGPRISTWMAKKQANILYETRESHRHKFSVTGIESAACGEDEPENLMSGWADRNPEFIWDMLWAPWRVKREVVDEILTDMFGRPIKVTLRLKVEARQLLGPQDIHLEQRCFSPQEIISIERCPPKHRR
jgi:hypothetical protein